jgi:hypothetical protein
MIKLTFAFDCQINDAEDYVKEGTEVKIFDKTIIKRDDCTPVVIKQAYDISGDKKDIYDIIWFMNSAFKEYQK